MSPVIEVSNLNKVYKDGGFQALNDVSLTIKKGEIFALLGPNGAGKTTLISMICGLTNITSGDVKVGGYSITSSDRNEARKLIGLVPQELTTDMFEPVIKTVKLSRGLFGLSPNSAYIEDILKRLSLWDKRNSPIMTLSGGMKRRVMIAKALAHEPKVLFLDEPTAGVDVELRRDMWAQIRELRESGVTIILTTHYIEEAEDMADRIGVIQNGQIVVVDDKDCLIKKMGKRHMAFDLIEPLETIPDSLSRFGLKLVGDRLIYDYDTAEGDRHISELFDALKLADIHFKDIETKQSSLEEIFVGLLEDT